eukprot:97179_1
MSEDNETPQQQYESEDEPQVLDPGMNEHLGKGAIDEYLQNIETAKAKAFDDSFDYQYYDNVQAEHSLPVSGDYNDYLNSGVLGGAAIVVIFVVFCLGLAFGMVFCWGYTHKKALDEQKRKEKMQWMKAKKDVCVDGLPTVPSAQN